MRSRLRKLWGNSSGVAAIEFGLLAPVLLTLFIGSLEVTFKIWSTQKAEKLAVTLSDVVAQSTVVQKTEIEKLVGAVDKIMEPFSFGNNGKVIISSVYREQGQAVAKVNWQCFSSSSYSATSKFGAKGADAKLPTGFTLAEKDNVIVAEVFYEYTPLAPGFLFKKNAIYRRAMFKPRLGALTTPPVGC